MRMHRAQAVALAAALLCACAAAPPKAPEGPPLVWPDDAGVPPRIAYVRAFTTPEDLGIEKGFLKRVAEFLFGGSEQRIVRPMAVVVDRGIIYVADPGVHGVHRFDTKEGNYDLIGAQGDEGLGTPVGLAAGSDGEVYVADSQKAVVMVIRPDAKFAVPVPLRDLGQPTGIAFDRATRRLFVIDTTAHRINVYDRDGTLQSTIGGRGERPGEFNYPTHLWRDASGQLYVTDALNFRMQVFDAQGRFVRTFGQSGDKTGDFLRQKGVATDSFGHVYVVDALTAGMQVFDGSGELLLILGGPGRDRGEFWLPTGLFIGSDDAIYVADSYNSRVQVFRYIGGPT